MSGRLILATAAATISVAAATIGTGQMADGITLVGLVFAGWELGAWVIEREASRLRESA